MESWKTETPYVSPKKGRHVRDKLEASPNGRAHCQRCGEKITKGQRRVGIQGKIQTAQGYPVWRLRYWHDGCVSEGTKRSLHLAPEGASSPSPKKARTNDHQADEKKPNTKSATNGSGAAASILKPRVRKQLENDLRALRRLFAETQDCEHYKIFQNKSLQDILTKLPTNRTELQQCWGIKEKRCHQYGDPILQIINSYLQPYRSRSRQQSGSTGANIHQQPRAVVAAAGNYDDDESDDDVVVVAGPTLSVEEIVRQRVREAEARGEVLEIL